MHIQSKKGFCQNTESAGKIGPWKFAHRLLVKYLFSTHSDFVNIGGTESSKSHVSTPDYLEKRQKVRRKSGNLIGGIPGKIRDFRTYY